MEEEIKKLREQITNLELQNSLLQKQLQENNNNNNKNNDFPLSATDVEDKHHFSHFPIQPLTQIDHLSNYQIARYGRHLLLPDFGVKGIINFYKINIMKRRTIILVFVFVILYYNCHHFGILIII